MSLQHPIWLEPGEAMEQFPPIEVAMREPDGLLAVGGDLSSERLIAAYRQGIFPWYSDDQPIMWWSPDPRMVLHPDKLKISRSLRKRIRKQDYQITLDQDFSAVIHACSESRRDQEGTWISDEMIAAYEALHRQGVAHSVECWIDGQLVGGLYGLAIGQVFFGESMFARISDASKLAFSHLVRQLQRWQFRLIDCQVYTQHLESLGAELIPRGQFKAALQASIEAQSGANWQMSPTSELMSDILKL